MARPHVDDRTRDLFAVRFDKRARRAHPATSHAAAASVVAFGHQHHAVIVRTLQRIGPATFDEIAAACGLTSVQVWKRLSELEQKLFLIERTGDTRPGLSGRACTVWRARQ